jgi:hypothetical protein
MITGTLYLPSSNMMRSRKGNNLKLSSAFCDMTSALSVIGTGAAVIAVFISLDKGGYFKKLLKNDEKSKVEAEVRKELSQRYAPVNQMITFPLCDDGKEFSVDGVSTNGKFHSDPSFFQRLLLEQNHCEYHGGRYQKQQTT